MPRHWFDESKKVDFPATEMQAIIDQTLGNIDSIIASVTSLLPTGFPDDITNPIFDGMSKAARKLKY